MSLSDEAVGPCGDSCNSCRPEPGIGAGCVSFPVPVVSAFPFFPLSCSMHYSLGQYPAALLPYMPSTHVQYLGDLGCDYVVYANDEKTVDEIKAMNPRGILISPGPGAFLPAWLGGTHVCTSTHVHTLVQGWDCRTAPKCARRHWTRQQRLDAAACLRWC